VPSPAILIVMEVDASIPERGMKLRGMDELQYLIVFTGIHEDFLALEIARQRERRESVKGGPGFVFGPCRAQISPETL
jgi:hypothetical protein